METRVERQGCDAVQALSHRRLEIEPGAATAQAGLEALGHSYMLAMSKLRTIPLRLAFGPDARRMLSLHDPSSQARGTGTRPAVRVPRSKRGSASLWSVVSPGRSTEPANLQDRSELDLPP